MEITEELWLKIPLRLMELGRYISNVNAKQVVFRIPYSDLAQYNQACNNLFPGELMEQEFAAFSVTRDLLLHEVVADPEHVYKAAPTYITVTCHFKN